MIEEVMGEEIVVIDGNEVQDADDGEIIVDTEESFKLRKEVCSLLAKVNETYWELAEALAKISNGKYFKAWGFCSFEGYLVEECGMRRAKGYSLAKIYNYFAFKLKESFTKYPNEYKRLMECIKEIGWSKARLLATDNIINPQNVDRIIELAKELSLEQLEIHCKTEFLSLPQKDKEDSDDDNTVKVVRKSFGFTIYQMEAVDQAVAKALTTMKEGATTSSALALVCQDFLSSNIEVDSSKDRAGNLAIFLSKLERVLGVDLVAFESGLCVYGQPVLADKLELEEEELGLEELESEELESEEEEELEDPFGKEAL